MSKTAQDTRREPWPISHPVAVANLPGRVSTVRLSADEGQRKATAKLLKIIAVDALDAEITLEPRGARVIVGGLVRAKVRQACVVTLEPVEQRVEEPVDFVFAPEEEAAEAERRVHAAAEKAEREGKLEDLAELFASNNLPDPIINGEIDLGHVVAETLAVGLDPYPRKEGAVFEQPAASIGETSPFAALGKLKR
jgi:hypothetical protein